MGAIADILDEPGKSQKGPPCTVCALIARCDADDVKRLEGWLSDTDTRYESLSKMLSDKGVGDYAPGTLARHARGKCWEMRQSGRKLR